MPSFRYTDSKEDQELKTFLENQDDKSDCIRKALYYYIHPEKSDVVKWYISRIQDLEVQIKILQQTILNLSNHARSAPNSNFLEEDDEGIPANFQIEDDKDKDQSSVDDLFTSKMSKLFAD